MSKIPFYKDPYFYRKHIYFLFLYLISLVISVYAPLLYNSECVFLLFETECEFSGTMGAILKFLVPVMFLLGFMAITFYKKLKLLRNVLNVNLLLHFVAVGVLLYLAFTRKVTLGVGGLLLIATITTLWVAKMNVNKDIKRLKSSERFV